MAVSGHSHFAIISTLNLGPWSTKLGGTVRAIKKLPTMTTDLVPAELRRKGQFYVQPKSRFFALKSVISQKKHPKFAKRLIFIWEKGTFWFAQLCPVVGT